MILGLGIGAFGYIRSSHSLRTTTGEITESILLRNGYWRLINYSYSVDSVKYTGVARVPYRLGHDNPYAVGAALPVYFVRSHPDTSYGFERPYALPYILGGLGLIGVGILIAVFGWPH